MTRIQYFISKGKEESSYSGDNNLEVVYQSLSYNIDLTSLKGCTRRMLNIHSEDLKDKKRGLLQVEVIVLPRGKGKEDNSGETTAIIKTMTRKTRFCLHYIGQKMDEGGRLYVRCITYVIKSGSQ